MGYSYFMKILPQLVRRSQVLELYLMGQLKIRQEIVESCWMRDDLILYFAV